MSLEYDVVLLSHVQDSVSAHIRQLESCCQQTLLHVSRFSCKKEANCDYKWRCFVLWSNSDENVSVVMKPTLGNIFPVQLCHYF